MNAGGGLLSPCVWRQGRLIGTWRRTLGAKQVSVEVRPFAPLDAGDRRAIERAAGRYAGFPGLELKLGFARPWGRR